MSRKKKILVIIQLCFAFTYLCWLLIQPYVKAVVTQKSERALYEMVVERQTFFEQLPEQDQYALYKGYLAATQKKSPSIWSELGHLFFVTTPAFALAWLFFAIAVCLLLLFHIEGASACCWLLPVLVLGYAYFLHPPARSAESLFPPEAYVMGEYVEPEEREQMGYRDSLLLGWHRFLIAEWAHETPSTDESLQKEQLEKGLFAFNAARLKWILEGKGNEVVLAGFSAPPSLARIICYLIWNTFFAWAINRKEKNRSFAPASTQAS